MCLYTHLSIISHFSLGGVDSTPPPLQMGLKGEYGGHDVDLIWWQRCQRWTAKTFFKIFWFSLVPAAWPVKFYSHFHTPRLRICIQLYCSFIHPFCTDFGSISTLEASDPKESGTVPEFSKMTPSRKQCWVCIPICCHNSIDGVI